MKFKRCETIRVTTYYTDTSKTNKRCVRYGRFIINDKHYCKSHAGQVALNILLNTSNNGVNRK